MLKIRRAQAKDREPVLEIIKQHDLSYPTQTLDHFWVAEEKGQVVAIADLWEFRGFFFLSSVGVAAGRQHRGIATKLLNKLLSGIRKDTFLFTVTPDFFSRFGFKVTADPPKGIPPRTIFACGNCTPETCVCMRRQANS
jgi:N-acetylglutamate synthase-like GNAT family acetyltransferase